MKIKVILSTGKVIELTEAEYDELRNGKLLTAEPISIPYHEVYPYWPYGYPFVPWNQPTVTYTDSTGSKEGA